MIRKYQNAGNIEYPDKTRVVRIEALPARPRKRFNVAQFFKNQKRNNAIREAVLQDSRNRNKGYTLKDDNNRSLANCIYTVTSMYNKASNGKVPTEISNMEFYENPGKYGFREVKWSEIKPGDMVVNQQRLHMPSITWDIKRHSYFTPRPTHAMIYNGVDNKGRHTFNYARGYTDERAETSDNYAKGSYYKYDSNLDAERNSKVYRYVGFEKHGGTLIPRDPVKRFKQTRNKLKVKQ